MDKVFDFHFHLLFKHYMARNPQGQELELNDKLETTGLAGLLNDILGGTFDSQAAPAQVRNSPLYLGITSIITIEYAFAHRVLNIAGLDLSNALPLNQELFRKTRNGETSYYLEFKNQLNMYLQAAPRLEADYRIKFLNRAGAPWQMAAADEIAGKLTSGEFRYLAFSIEGGHNLSDVLIHQNTRSQTPERQLLEIQNSAEADFFSLNLCHLSDIPEQQLGGFAQGMNKLAQVAFSSDEFMPKTGLGLTESGKKVIRQALTHASKPILIDVKHMSIYTRMQYYRFRERLIREHPETERLPIVASHIGFTFTTLADYVGNKRFKSTTGQEGGLPVSLVQPENRRTGRTNDFANKKLYCNPWTINLFDEEILEIMESDGMLGLSLDQRILGVSNPAFDSFRDKYFEAEYVAYPEWEKLFRDGQLPGAEALGFLKDVFPSRNERHVMLLCLHLVHAARVGYANLNWVEGTSPWDHLCIGSDFDGLINPINLVENVEQLANLKGQLEKYLPQADKFLLMNKGTNALRYTGNGDVDQAFLQKVISQVLFDNGVRLLTRFLRNWNA